jgi:hypothetical protein
LGRGRGEGFAEAASKMLERRAREREAAKQAAEAAKATKFK